MFSPLSIFLCWPVLWYCRYKFPKWYLKSSFQSLAQPVFSHNNKIPLKSADRKWNDIHGTDYLKKDKPVENLFHFWRKLLIALVMLAEKKTSSSVNYSFSSHFQIMSGQRNCHFDMIKLGYQIAYRAKKLHLELTIGHQLLPRTIQKTYLHTIPKERIIQVPCIQKH